VLLQLRIPSAHAAVLFNLRRDEAQIICNSTSEMATVMAGAPSAGAGASWSEATAGEFIALGKVLWCCLLLFLQPCVMLRAEAAVM
jgi:hypothetical protein